MLEEKKDQRVTIMMSASELERLDDWAFKERIRSRGEAIRRIVAGAVSEDGATPLQKANKSGANGRPAGNKI